MFKAKLIENQEYYALRSKQFLLILLPSIFIGFLVNFFMLPTWATIVLIGLYILPMFLLFSNQKKMGLMGGDYQIEIDADQIRILDKNNKLKEQIQLADVDKLMIKEDYKMPGENVNDVAAELVGKTNKSFIIIHKNGESKRIDFEFDSYYMITQLQKTINTWASLGYKIESIEKEQ